MVTVVSSSIDVIAVSSGHVAGHDAVAVYNSVASRLAWDDTLAVASQSDSVCRTTRSGKALASASYTRVFSWPKCPFLYDSADFFRVCRAQGVRCSVMTYAPQKKQSRRQTPLFCHRDNAAAACS